MAIEHLKNLLQNYGTHFPDDLKLITFKQVRVVPVTPHAPLSRVT